MKKLFITFLILGVASGAFAQFTRQLLVDINPNALVVTTPLGDSADPAHTRYDGDGTFGLLTPYVGSTMGKENDLRFSLGYSAQNYGASIRLRFDSFIRPNGLFTQRGGSGTLPSIGTILNTTLIDEYRVWGTVGRFTADVRNTAERGRVTSFSNGFDDFGIRPVKINDYGVNTPASDLLFRESDSNNFRSNNVNGEYHRADFYPYFLFTANFAPFSVQLAGDIADHAFDSVFTPKDNAHLKVNGGIRISGNRIADLVTFDAIYKFRGGDLDSDDNLAQPDGKGVVSHNFGIYANLHVLDTLGIGLGYTGLVRAYEKYEIGDTSYDRFGPYFSGIDIRLQFTGINRLRLTMHNNISFAVVNGADPNDKMVYGVLGNSFSNPTSPPTQGALIDNTNTIGFDESESWFGLYNAIGARYNLTDALHLNVDVGNRLGIVTNTLNEQKNERLSNSFGAALWAGYSVNRNVSLQGGVRFLVQSFAHKYEQDPNLNDESWGTFTFAVPLRVMIIY